MQRKLSAETRSGLLLCLFILAAVAALTILPYQFRSEAVSKKGLFTRTESADPSLPNYDIRTSKDAHIPEFFESARNTVGKNAVSVADVRENFVRGEEALKARQPQVKFEYNEDIRIPEVITPDVWKAKIEYLSSPSSQKRSDILRNFVKENDQLVGVDNNQADSLVVTQDYTNPDGNISYAQLEQRINGVPVFRGEIKAGFTKDGRIIRVINNLAPGLDYGSLSADFRNPADAVKAAARAINHNLKAEESSRNDAESTDLKSVFGTGDWATTAEKMYFPTEPAVAVAAWRVLIWEPVNAYYVIVDANTGTMLWRKNITNDQSQSSTYNVYRNPTSYIDVADSPAPLSPGPLDPNLGTQGVNATRTNITLVGNEAPNTFNNNGWITDGANITDGNALEAGIDRDGTNGVDAPVTGTPVRVFDSLTWNPPPGTPAPGDNPLTVPAQRGAVTQMFYAMNRYHDELYKRGFTEAAFNFQGTNFTGMGAGADRVSAEGQDSAGTNNANFSTPADGGRGRMQMFLWTGPTPDYDGTADAEVIYHEVTHGTSNRLHGNSSGLSTNMAGGMGEGWGDWYAEVMLAEPSDPINSIHTTGGYATYLIAAGFTGNYYYGIRRFPRAPITFLGANGRPHNPYTFRYVNAGCASLLDGSTSAFPRGPIGVAQCDQVHNLGEVWSSMLWEVRDRMVTRLGFTAGTARVLQVVTDGMKLAPLGPTFLQERDAIIAAASALPIAPEASADVADVREGFRVRGMGFSASIQTASPAAVTEAFDTANVTVTSPFSVSDTTGNNNGVPEPGENVLLSIAVTNTTGGTATNVQVSVNGGANVSYGTINDGQTVTNQVPFAISAAAPCGSTQTVSIVVSSNLGAQPPVQRSFTLGTPVGTVQNFDGVVAPALPSGWTTTQDSGTGISWATTATGPSSAPNSAFANDPVGVNISSLVSPVIPVTSSSAQLKFKNRYITESTFDGMVLEIKVGAGAFADIVTAGGSFVSGGYNATISTGFMSPIAGRQAWSGTSAGGYIDTVVNLPAAANGQSVQLRWRMASDTTVASTGVNVDNVELVSSFTCAPINSTPKSRADFDGDGKSDLSVFRPTEGNWYLNRSTAGLSVVNWGNSTDTIVPGDYDGDGKADTAVFRASSDPAVSDYLILNSNGFVFKGFAWGVPADVPVTGDYDGDGKTDLAVFRPSTGTWFVLNSGNGSNTVQPFGLATDRPVSIDNDGDGKTNLAVYRPTENTWYIARPTGTPATNFDAIPFGATGDQLVQADYDGDNKDDVAVFRPSNGTWYVRGSLAGTTTFTAFGSTGDVAVPGDYDGDGKDDLAVYRGGTWYVQRSTAGSLVQAFGLGTDVPVPVRYLPPAAGGGGGGGPVTVSYTGPAVVIPDNVPAGINIVVPVTGVGTISDLNFSFDGTVSSPDPLSTTVGLNHSFVGDLIVKLTSPGGTTVTIVDRPGVPATTFGCGNNNFYQLVLNDDGGLPPIETGCNGTNTALIFPSGPYSGNNPLSAFDTQNADGNWTVNISDNTSVDTGSVRAFSFIFNSGN